jgi:molybdopterin molybdotransferase
MTPGDPFHDPRMRGFRSRTSVEAVLALIGRRVGRLGPETIDPRTASGRVLAGEVVADAPVPSFDRAAMDGFAVRGEETFGADSYSPIPFQLIGRIRPGADAHLVVGPGQAAEIATGAPLPEGADTVVRVEATEVEGKLVRVSEPTPPGRHVGLAGEDIARGAVVLPGGRVLRPQDLGVLSAIGLDRVEVVRRPTVAILVTGDELVPAGTRPTGSRISDANSPILAALVDRDGGLPSVIGPLRDDRELIRSAIVEASRVSDLLLISGGSSTGPEDHAPGLVAELGELAVHGIAIRPASPAGLGFLGDRAVVLLPGNPVSCLCAYDFFAGPIVRRLGGRPPGWPYRPIDRPMARKLASVVGRVDYARVAIVEGQVEPLAISGASILSSTTRADGFVVVPEALEGYPVGASVTVWLYDQDG